MNLRFAATIAGCMLLGAGAAAYHRGDSRPAAPAPLAAMPPLVMQAATGAPASAVWPPGGPVAFYQDMLALSTAVATARAPAAQAATTPPTVRDGAPQIPQPPQPPQSAGGPPPRGDNTVEIVIRDRFGRPIGVRRVDRRLLAGGRGYPPPRRQY